ncbi:MAG TPA: MFS transporter, partial [Streptosporangiaceae bacterium]
MTHPANSTGEIQATAATPPAEDPHYARRWWILAVLGIAQLMVVLDVTVVNIALPHAQAALTFSNTDRQWIVTGYSLAFGSLLLLGGRVADLFGRKRIFLIGVVGFACASAFGGAAQNFDMLLAARVIQGAFGALLAPATLSLLTTTFTDPGERSKATGIYGGIAGAGASIGLLLGGVLTEYLDWRWVMYVNVLIAVIAFAGGVVLLKNVPSLNRPKLDLVGVVLAGVGLFCLVYGFSNASMSSGSSGWTKPATLAALIAGAVLIVTF